MFLRFCLVGTLGFFTDTVVLLLITQIGASGTVSGRVISFLTAACITWSLNRRFTFRSKAPTASLAPYIGLTALGALLNVGIYWIWISMFGASWTMLVLGLAMGSIAALSFNFGISKYVVFAARRPGSGA